MNSPLNTCFVLSGVIAMEAVEVFPKISETMAIICPCMSKISIEKILALCCIWKQS